MSIGLEAIVALTAIVGGFSGIIISALGPIMKLNTAITRLNDNLDHVIRENSRQDSRLDGHGRRLESLETTVTRHDVEISNIKGGRL